MTTTTRGATRGGSAPAGGARTGRAAAPTRTRPAERGQAPRTTGTARAPRRPAAPARAPRMPFVLLVLGLLAGALISLLALRTVLVEDSFTIARLQAENSELINRQESLQEEVVHLESPERIAREAEGMGMEQGEAPGFLYTDEGRVSGEGGEGSGGASGDGR
ncbi:hypothetical protein O4J56_30295 [Nocardiopsis sp. RSe5-2]|uniref:Cell division protein FtsL n=1 Tax=Nocardiopsis endophytica TaxID=3018445 RepID=A0ABT4UDB5_9ACTN|nr:hypothetical protein [Nocardiopsis endophytica]MDA2814974.1 hypothetical protein [Nocardiopsis endophytica]